MIPAPNQTSVLPFVQNTVYEIEIDKIVWL